MKTSAGFATVAQSLFRARVEIASLELVKDAQGDKAKYIRIGTLLASLEPVLFAHKWMIVQDCEEIRDGMILGTNVVTTLVHETGEWISGSVPIPIVGPRISKQNGGGYGERDPQAGGIAVSYGRRYGLFALLSLAIDEDTDGARLSRRKRAAMARLSAGEASAEGSARHTEWFEAGIMPIGEMAGVEMRLLKGERLRRAMRTATEAGKREEALAISAELTRRTTTPGWKDPVTEPPAPPKGAIA